MQVFYFFSIQEKFPHAERVDEPMVAMGIRRDVHIFNEHFVAAESGVAVGDVDPPLPDRLNLVPLKHYPAFERFENLVFVPGAAIR